MQEKGNSNYLKGAAILAAASIIVKITGAVYKIPLLQDGVLGLEGSGDFNTTYRVYSLILTIATAGIPAALSRLVSSAAAKGNSTLVRRYFSVALPSFLMLGLAAMLFMFFFADMLASAMGNPMAKVGIQVLSPAVFFVCIISVYRGYAQGHQNMFPTAISQVIEVLCKAIFGVAVALWFVRLGFESHIVSAGAIVGVTIGLGLAIPVLIWYKKRLDRTFKAKVEIKNENSKPDKSEADNKYSFGSILGSIMKVSVPITITASFMSIMAVLDTGIILRRLQSMFINVYAMTDTTALSQARSLLGTLSRAETLYNLTPALLVPISVSIIPAIAAELAKGRNDGAKNIMQSSLKIVNLIAMPAAAGLMVLAMPILTAIYNDNRETAQLCLIILGAATFFVCLQYITTAILQANGHERVSLITFPIGAAAKIAITWFLAGNPDFGILASPIGTLVCFAVISVLNILFITVKLPDRRPEFLAVFFGPAMCSVVMATVTFGLYTLLASYLKDIISNQRFEAIVFLGISIFTGIVVYTILVIVTRTVTMDDVKLIPKGEKIGRFLRIKQ